MEEERSKEKMEERKEGRGKEKEKEYGSLEFVSHLPYPGDALRGTQIWC